MKYLLPLLLLAALPAQPATETLRYNVNWPSGLSLGEATFTADNIDASAAARKFEFRLEASVPGFSVLDEVLSSNTSQYCATKVEKKLKHGPKSSMETLDFTSAPGKLQRKTEKGGKSEMEVGACSRDALGFLYFLRSELRAGRIPPSQPVYFGAAYQLTIKFAGTTTVSLNGANEAADRFQISIKGPASQNNFELFLGKDSARTPLLVRVPLPISSFSLELIR